MAILHSQLQKPVTRQLGLRATSREEILITTAANMATPRVLNRNQFVLNAALEAARKVLKENGIDEEELLRGKPPAPTKSRRKVAA